ncbi:hypothetical protein D6783_03275 [Candidatus Woesearchaeota archaeon]|nr:MAG: hypothetical protein D6783_03275 [Candidatus Woesearchaeota archaeon]
MSATQGKDADARVADLQVIEQELQAQHTQKQLFESQLMEAQSALKALEDAQEAFRIVGSVMVSADAKVLRDEVRSRVEALQKRVEHIEKQEARLRKQASALQDAIMEDIKRSKVR